MLQVTSRYQAPNLKVSNIQTVAEIIFGKPDDYLKQGVQVAAGFPHINVGDVLGRITTTGLYRRITRATVKTTISGGAVSAVLTDELGNAIESPFVPGDVVDFATTGAGADNSVTITTVNNATGAIGFAALTYGHTAGGVVTLHTVDGSEVAVGIAQHPVQPASYDSTYPSNNYLLDSDYDIDCILVGAVVRSKLRGMDATALTAMGGFSLYPAFDAYVIR